MTTYLLKNVNTDTIGDTFIGSGGKKKIHISSPNFGGGSVILQSKAEINLEWTTISYGGNPAVFTANTMVTFDEWTAGLYLRAVLAGSTGANAVNVAVI